MLMAAALVLAAVAAGRVLGLIANGLTDGAMTSLTIEVSVIAALLICARSVRMAEAQKSAQGFRGRGPNRPGGQLDSSNTIPW